MPRLFLALSLLFRVSAPVLAGPSQQGRPLQGVPRLGPAIDAQAQRGVVLDQANLFRAILRLPALTEAHLTALDAVRPAIPDAARIHAASAYLERLGDPARAEALARTLQAAGVAAADGQRLKLMAQKIVAAGDPRQRQAAVALVEGVLPSSPMNPSSANAGLTSLASRLESADQSRVPAILDAFFSARWIEPNVVPALPASSGAAKIAAPLTRPAAATKALKKEDSASAAASSPDYDLLSRAKKISQLQNLVETDPAAALEFAAQVLRDADERRPEVVISAMRALDQVASPASLAVLIETLKGDDWYLRREAARVIGKLEPVLEGPARQAAVEALDEAFKDSKTDFKAQSWRLMVGEALRRFGVEPGAEPQVAADAAANPVSIFKRDVNTDIWPKIKPAMGKIIFALIILWLLVLLGLIVGPMLGLMSSGPADSPYALSFFLFTLLGVMGVFLLGLLLVGGYKLQKDWAKKPDRAMTPNVHFSDIAGIDDASIEIREIMDFLKDPQRYKRLGSRPPKGVLLVGPPGTGKTLLAKALAGDSNASFYEAVGSDFIEMYVGVGASRVRALFSKARNHAPAVIFIDEIDSIGGARGDSINRSSEDDKTLTALLAEMDGFDNSKGVIIIAATNRPESLDPALKRPGRFDRVIDVSLPDKLGREAILQLHAGKIRLGVDADFGAIAQRTPGLSGAFLENIINEAAALASRRGADSVGMEDLIEASDRQTVGQKRNFFVSDKQKLHTARHEAGHALVELLGGGKIDKLTIIPHGSASLGHARTEAEDDKHSYSRSELEHKLNVYFGGLAAEELTYGQFSTGPGSDLEQATNLARTMVEQLGMGKKSGFEVHARQGQAAMARPISEQTKREMDLDVRDILNNAHKKAVKDIKTHRAGFDRLIEALLEKETLTGAEVSEIAGLTPR